MPKKMGLIQFKSRTSQAGRGKSLLLIPLGSLQLPLTPSQFILLNRPLQISQARQRESRGDPRSQWCLSQLAECVPFCLRCALSILGWTGSSQERSFAFLLQILLYPVKTLIFRSLFFSWPFIFSCCQMVSLRRGGLNSWFTILCTAIIPISGLWGCLIFPGKAGAPFSLA